MDDSIVYMELRLAAGPMTPTDIAAATPLTTQRARQALRRLMQIGLVAHDPEADTWTIAAS